MSEYYAEHESIAEISTKLTSNSTEMDNSAVMINASAKRISRSKTLDSLGYSSLTSRTQTSVTKLSGKVKEISNILNTVSGLYADYESRVISALNDTVTQGNNYSPESRAVTREENDIHNNLPINPGSSNGGYVDDKGLTNYVNPTPEQKRQYMHEWLEKYHPDLLEQLYDRLHSSGGVAAAATAAGLGGAGIAAAGMMSPTVAGESAAGGTDAGGAGAGGADAGGAGAGGADAGGAGAGGADAGGGAGGADAGGAGGGAGAGDDWVADALNDAVDSDKAQQAQGALGQMANTSNPGATQTGAGALSDSASMGFATDNPNGFAEFMGNLGSGFVDMVQKYGIQAGIFVGGAGVAYASSGVAIEAVAHCAEFVATKCMPGVNGFMEQASAVVQVTRISIRAVVGSIAQGVGGLFG